MSQKQRVIVSPVGISAFFNILTGEERQKKGIGARLNTFSNAKELPDEMAAIVEELSERISTTLRNGSVQERRRLSAELNGLYGFYEDQMRPNGDIHMLIATDTALGYAATEIIETFLKNTIGFKHVEIVTPTGLNTASVDDFSQGIKDLLNKFEERLPGYEQAGYEIIFNLTGGFKSLQGYLSIIGMFYADRLVYIFERSDELLNIPRLPLTIDHQQLKEYAAELAQLAAGGVFPRDQLQLQGALLDVDEQGDATLSDWGLLVWNRVKDQWLNEKLLDFPYLEYEKSFQKEFDKAEPELRVKLQETLAKVSVLLQESDGNIAALKRDGGLQYDQYSGQKASDVPVGHFRIDGGNRVTCLFINGKLYLRHFGSHDDTERAEGI